MPSLLRLISGGLPWNRFCVRTAKLGKNLQKSCLPSNAQLQGTCHLMQHFRVFLTKAISFYLLPTKAGDQDDRPPKPWKGSGKGNGKKGERGTKRDADGKEKVQPELPDALKDIPNLKRTTNKGKRLCWSYNIKDRGCKHASAGKACRFGLHLCMKCGKAHPQFECTSGSSAE